MTTRRTLLAILLLTLPIAAQTTPQVPTLQASAKLVVVDVTVTDPSGKPVKGLKPQDFELLEGKSPQTIASFEEHDALPTGAAAPPLRPMPKLGPGVYTNFTPTPVNSAINILLLDSLNTPMKDQAFMVDQLKLYLKRMKPTDRVAIFGLTTRLLMLQGFTSDPETLRRALDKHSPKASPLLDDTVGDGSTTASAADLLTAQSGDSGITASQLASVANFEAGVAAMQLTSRAETTLDALNELARYLAAIPGRKNLIWFSGSFPVTIQPDSTTMGDLVAAQPSFSAEFRQTSALLGRAQVAVYPIDARGLMISPLNTSTDAMQTIPRNPQTLVNQATAFVSRTADEHSTMFEMARDTGGKAFVNTNGLANAVAEAIGEGSNYYTLAYSPTDKAWTGKYRSIHLKLLSENGNDNAKAKLAYRQGYFAIDPSAPLVRPATSTAKQTAALHGAPPATQILFRARITPTSVESTPAPIPGNEPTADSKGPWRPFLVQMQAEERNVARTLNPDGTTSFKVRFVTLVYDPDGKVINGVSNTIPANLTPEALANVKHRGIEFQQQISVPEKGNYSLRILIDDELSGHLGSLELPIAPIRNLPVPAPPKPAQ